MAVRRPSLAELETAAAAFGLGADRAAIEAYREVIDRLLVGFDTVDALPDELPPVRYPRTPGTRPAPAE